MTRLAAARALLVLSALTALASFGACASPTAPTTGRIQPPTSIHRGMTDTTCRGWTQGNGFHCP